MSKITEKNHALKNVKATDVKFVRACLYDTEKYETTRLNISLKFESDSEFYDLHDSDGFVKLVAFPKIHLHTINRRSNHPEWSGISDMYDWAKEEAAGNNTGKKPLVTAISKGNYVGKRGINTAPEPAYYTCFVLSMDDQVSGVVKFRVGSFDHELMMSEAVGTESKYFQCIGQEEIWHP